MAVPYQAIHDAAVAIIGDVETPSGAVITQAPSNYGTDFRITPGEARFQVQLSIEKNYPLSSNESYPRAIVTILIHHYATSLADENTFAHFTMQVLAQYLMVSSVWGAESGVRGFQPDGSSHIDPEISDGERVGNVITFEISAAVLADAA
jgi:hypothetical protein